MINTGLFGVDLRAARLWREHMEEANLQFARLQGIDLEYAHFECADLHVLTC